MDAFIQKQEAISAARKRLQKLHDYIDVTPEISRRIGNMWRIAEAQDTGDGKAYTQCVNAVFRKFATQTF